MLKPAPNRCDIIIKEIKEAERNKWQLAENQAKPSPSNKKELDE